MESCVEWQKASVGSSGRRDLFHLQTAGTLFQSRESHSNDQGRGDLSETHGLRPG